MPPAKSSTAAAEPHPLFTPDRDSTQGAIGRIYVQRGGITCPRVFQPDELQSLDQLFELFGGGTYLIRARDPENKQWTGSFQIVLPGAPKPLVPDPAPAPPAFPVSHGPPDMTALILQMFMEGQRISAQMQMEAQKSMNALLVAVLGKEKAPDIGVSHVLDFAKSAMLESRRDNPGDPVKAAETMLDTFQAGLEFARGIKEPRDASGPPSDLVAIVDGIKEFGKMHEAKQRAMPPPNPPPRHAPPPPPTAARPSPPPPPPRSPPPPPTADEVATARAFFGDALSDDDSDAFVVRRYRDARSRMDDA